MKKKGAVHFFSFLALYIPSVSVHFYAVSGYHLWCVCDDVGFATRINIHTLCKQV